MSIYQTSVIIDESKQVILSDLPFPVGQKLQVMIIAADGDVTGDENAQIDVVIAQYRQEGKLRPFGLCAGEFVVPDDFNEPLPDEIVDLFYPE
ncbi:MAG TPA: type II toxin-antitoxin system Phd/YefM family antitoxin [Oscillatoriaceae cyanobacterium M33_DOE_052]|uniref:Type II toxin-antitoxin system Phd/YefM family antitoxin n=1 Tax=Planktothricoides sp. SpSt-374 TaxID=2282167 RepID=A0A7C3ZIK6_9CYAN|nr:type II toxin-antitoxin system Phd/YefM family antitoxin [Oscillatoriaceae cyanobacterium M33_DOE_052]